MESDWRPGESRLDKRRVCIFDLRDSRFRLVLTRQEAEDLILKLEIEVSDMPAPWVCDG